MNIRKNLGIVLASIALLLACGVACFAKNSQTVAVTHNVVLNGTTLPAGQYVISWEVQSPRASVQFARGKKVVLSTQCTFEDRGKRNDSSAVVYGTAPDGSNSISEIRLSGSNGVLVFNQ